MKDKTITPPNNKRLTGIVAAVAILLAIPFVAMQFTAEVAWTLSDFIVMGFLLLSTGLVGEQVWRKVKKKRHRIGLITVAFAIFILIWLELAVGIFGTPLAGS